MAGKVGTELLVRIISCRIHSIFGRPGNGAGKAQSAGMGA